MQKKKVRVAVGFVAVKEFSFGTHFFTPNFMDSGKPVRPPKKPARRSRRNRKRPASRLQSEDGNATGERTLYDVENFLSLTPTQDCLSHNVDCAGFTQVMESTYSKMAEIDTRLRRQMPFCLFQHYVVEALTAHLLDLAAHNGDRRFRRGMGARGVLGGDNIILPAPIFEYISMINNATTSNGERVLVSLPAAAAPQGPVAEATSGSFGASGVNNHNAYECYFSPAITRGLIEATRDDNAEWYPLPGPNLVLTRNCLGYRARERLNNEGTKIHI
ncbi:hypothetical protein U1Q18_051697 [Sarracenia purpurea var. burkii]